MRASWADWNGLWVTRGTSPAWHTGFEPPDATTLDGARGSHPLPMWNERPHPHGQRVPSLARCSEVPGRSAWFVVVMMLLLGSETVSLAEV